MISDAEPAACRRMKARAIISSPLGPLRLRWENGVLTRLALPSAPPGRINPSAAVRGGDDWYGILDLKGVVLDLKAHSPFRRLVWQRTMTVPFGQTISYGRLAREIGLPGASRAVGGALGDNPWPLLIPCHRVIRSDGSLGGFSSGLEWKRYLLGWERGAVKNRE